MPGVGHWPDAVGEHSSTVPTPHWAAHAIVRPPAPVCCAQQTGLFPLQSAEDAHATTLPPPAPVQAPLLVVQVKFGVPVPVPVKLSPVAQQVDFDPPQAVGMVPHGMPVMGTEPSFAIGASIPPSLIGPVPVPVPIPLPAPVPPVPVPDVTVPVPVPELGPVPVPLPLPLPEGGAPSGLEKSPDEPRPPQLTTRQPITAPTSFSNLMTTSLP